MKSIFLFALIGVSAAGAQDQPAPAPSKTAAKKKAAKSTAKMAAKPAAKEPTKPAPPLAKTLTIPAEATANSDGTYSYTDKSGVQWTYRNTPFGVSRIQNTAAASSGFASTPKDMPKEQLIQTADQGETVKFSRQTPFGTSTWEKKKSEMTDEERSIYHSQHPDNNQ